MAAAYIHHRRGVASRVARARFVPRRRRGGVVLAYVFNILFSYSPAGKTLRIAVGARYVILFAGVGGVALFVFAYLRKTWSLARARAACLCIIFTGARARAWRVRRRQERQLIYMPILVLIFFVCLVADMGACWLGGDHGSSLPDTSILCVATARAACARGWRATRGWRGSRVAIVKHTGGTKTWRRALACVSLPITCSLLASLIYMVIMTVGAWAAFNNVNLPYNFLLIIIMLKYLVLLSAAKDVL